MTIMAAVILGLVQGLTEFIPVSSSGHLALFHSWLSEQPSLVFDAVLHLGTLLAVLLYYRQRCLAIMVAVFHPEPSTGQKKDRKIGWFIVLATIPAVLVGYFFGDQIETVFEGTWWAARFMLLLGLVMLTFEVLMSHAVGVNRSSGRPLRWWRALVVGLAQTIALLPGVSRSGMTMMTGMVTGIKRGAAAEFSFLMSIPVILGAGILSALSLGQETGISWLTVALGLLASFVAGYAAIAFLIQFLRHHTFALFGFYLVALAGIVIAFSV